MITVKMLNLIINTYKWKTLNIRVNGIVCLATIGANKYLRIGVNAFFVYRCLKWVNSCIEQIRSSRNKNTPPPEWTNPFVRAGLAPL